MIIVRKEQLGTDGKRFAYPGKAFTDLDAAARYAAYFAAEQAGVPGTWIVLRGLAFYAHAVGTAAFPGLVLADGLGFGASLGAFGTERDAAVGRVPLPRVDELRQTRHRVRIGQAPRDGRREVLRDALVECRAQQHRLGGEVAVEGAFTDAGMRCDSAHLGVRAHLRIHRAGRAQDPLGIADGISPCGAIHRGCHPASLTTDS